MSIMVKSFGSLGMDSISSGLPPLSPIRKPRRKEADRTDLPKSSLGVSFSSKIHVVNPDNSIAFGEMNLDGSCMFQLSINDLAESEASLDFLGQEASESGCSQAYSEHEQSLRTFCFDKSTSQSSGTDKKSEDDSQVSLGSWKDFVERTPQSKLSSVMKESPSRRDDDQQSQSDSHTSTREGKSEQELKHETT